MKSAVLAQARKEFRQLLPWWAITAAGLVIFSMAEAWSIEHAFQARPQQFWLVGLLTYGSGAVMLGAMAIGHEYSHHTLPALLLQPVARTQVLLVKAGVLAVLLATLAWLAIVTLGFNMIGGGPRSMVFGWLPIACGFCLAPLVTMVCRTTLAGAVLSAAGTLALFPAGSALGVPYSATLQLVLGLSVVSAMLSWWTFTRLQVAGGPQTEIDLAARFRRAPRNLDDAVPVSRRRHPLRLLLGKELRLQQPTFAVSACFVLAWLVATAARAGASGPLPDDVLYIAAFLHGGLVPLMAGALASAEERRFGTADWHRLLPMSARMQWAVKAGVAVLSGVALSVALPMLMMRLAPDPGLESAGIPIAVGMALLSLSALYVSSLSANGVHALLATPPLVGGAVLLTMVTTWPLNPVTQRLAPGVAALLDPVIRLERYAGWFDDCVWWAVVGLNLMLLWFSYVNHSSADRSARTIVRQLGWLGTYILVAGFVLTVMSLMFVRAVSGRV